MFWSKTIYNCIILSMVLMTFLEFCLQHQSSLYDLPTLPLVSMKWFLNFGCCLSRYPPVTHRHRILYCYCWIGLRTGSVCHAIGFKDDETGFFNPPSSICTLLTTFSIHQTHRSATGNIFRSQTGALIATYRPLIIEQHIFPLLQRYSIAVIPAYPSGATQRCQLYFQRSRKCLAISYLLETRAPTISFISEYN